MKKKLLFILLALVGVGQMAAQDQDEEGDPIGGSHDTEKYWDSESGLLFLLDTYHKTATLLPYDETIPFAIKDGYCGTVVIPEKVKALYTVTKIANFAFERQTDITSVKMPNTITSIDKGAFSEAQGLTSVILSESLTAIPDQCFFHCNGLKSITIPASVTSIGNKAFESCTRLKTVTLLPATPPSLGYEAFYTRTEDCTIIVPNESYLTAEGWKDNTNLRLPLADEKVRQQAIFLAYIKDLFGENYSYHVESFVNKTINDINNATDYKELNQKLELAKDFIESEIDRHTHTYGDWESCSDTQHCHVCSNEDGYCTQLTVTEDHDLRFDHVEGTKAYYTCSVRHATIEREAPGLSLTAVDGDMTIGMNKTGNPDNYIIQYSDDGIVWKSPTTLTKTTGEIVTIPEGYTYFFRHGTSTPISGISKGYNDCWSFTMTGDGTVEAGGNILYLLDETGEKSTITAQHAFTRLFYGCSNLTVAPPLPNAIYAFCYVGMFARTGITAAPALPTATTVPDGAYIEMFRECKNLTTAPCLPGTELRRRAYDKMFDGCTKLTSVETAQITKMSYDTSVATDHPLNDWLKDTADEGMVITPIGMVCDEDICTHIPAGWTTGTRIAVSAAGMATLCLPFDAVCSSDAVTAYYATEVSGEGVTFAPIDGPIKAGEGILVKGTAGSYLFGKTTGAEAPATNHMVGVCADTDCPGTGSYILVNGSDGIGFYSWNTGSLGAYKAYLRMPDGGTSSSSVTIRFDDGSTTVGNILRAPEAGAVYDLQGRRVTNVGKGIYIVDGKKMIRK